MQKPQYSIYGNDDQQLFNQILQEKDKISDLVYQKLQKDIENRKKHAEKYKKVLDNKKNINPNEKVLDDVYSNDFDSYKGKNEDIFTKTDDNFIKSMDDIVKNKSNPTKTDLYNIENNNNVYNQSLINNRSKILSQKKINEKNMKFEDEHPNSSKNILKIILSVIIVLIILAILGFGAYQVLFKEKGNIQSSPTQTNEQIINTIPLTEPIDNVGIKLASIDNTHEYSFEETLSFTNDVNKGINDYWTELIQKIDEAKQSKDVNKLVSALNLYKNNISIDIQNLTTYQNIFVKNELEEFYTISMLRYSNFQNIIDKVEEYDNLDKIIVEINKAIITENEYNKNIKEQLCNYLDSKGIEYSFSDEIIQYSINKDVTSKEANSSYQAIPENPDETNGNPGIKIKINK